MFIESFGTNVFNDEAKSRYLSADVLSRLTDVRSDNASMDEETADAVASAMLKWALEKGATHYTHWFQPMTGITAEKHEGFIDMGADGKPCLKFTRKALIKGEADASSFPSGGMRATFEGRGYTVWDPSSDAFIKDRTLYIPTAFCSYTGAVLDKKTPLLRSMSLLNRQAKRILSLLGENAGFVYPTVGCEQEYFLVNREDYKKREDLVLTGRTLFGHETPKGQILENHYYGSIRPRVKAFMEELDETLWELGIYSKTEHNEVAPCQHEMAAVFNRANVAADQNQLVMDVMKKVAENHGFVCLLHEKPFAGINGSGKHNNWSLSTDTGENLLNPGKHPEKNIRFLLFLTACIRAVDNNQDLLRISAATASNDYRLGGNEAPPAIISVFLGEDLEELCNSIIMGEERKQPVSGTTSIAESLPALLVDKSDRNRTSPFAFTGNRFEFRMPGASVNVSCANYIINTAVADSLRVFADELSKEVPSGCDIKEAAYKLIKRELSLHKRIIFSGNGYDGSWAKEAERRGLLNIKSTPEAYSYYDSEKNVKLLEENGILSRDEIVSRKLIGLSEYQKLMNIEIKTMIEMASKKILPAVSAYSGELAKNLLAKKELLINVTGETELLQKINGELGRASMLCEELSELYDKEPEDTLSAGLFINDTIKPVMESLRVCVDRLETLTDKKYWPIPDYTDLLFYV